MRAIPLLTLLALAACSGGSTKDSDDTDGPVDTDDGPDTDPGDSDDAPTDEALPTELAAFDSQLLGWILADHTPAGEHARIGASRGGFWIVPSTFEGDTATEPRTLTVVADGDRRALRFGAVTDDRGEAGEYARFADATLPDGAPLTGGTLALRYRYLNEPGWYEYAAAIGDFNENSGNGTGTFFAVARNTSDQGGYLYAYDNNALITSAFADAGGTWHTVVARFGAGGATFRLDGVAGTTDTTGSTAWSIARTLQLGHMEAGNNAGNVEIRELVLLDTAVSDADAATLETWLGR